MPTSKKFKKGLFWFRRDLRLEDNPGLTEAIRSCDQVMVVYIHSEDASNSWNLGGASKFWLHHSLKELDQGLGPGVLYLAKGSPKSILEKLVQKEKIDAVFWNRLYSQYERDRDTAIKKDLTAAGCDVESFNGLLMREPWEVLKKDGTPYQVYTPYWKAFIKSHKPRSPLKRVSTKSLVTISGGLKLEALQLLPKIDWTTTMEKIWKPGSKGAKANLNRLLKEGILDSYGEGRDIPSRPGTSQLSPHLAFGEISVCQIWHTVLEAPTDKVPAGQEQYLKELVWREFAYHLNFHFPDTDREPLRKKYALFPWQPNKKYLQAWQKGQTGYPIVDAGMRQLWATGWMHNRVRMIVASFLVKHLLQPWQDGALWFWDTLVDADLASNSFGWQWAAGCGADAAPYFRIFNPTLQGKKFDPDGAYVKQWVPELAKVPKKYLHSPWEASALEMSGWGIKLGRDYPKPIVDHKKAREKALAALGDLKEING